MKTRVFILLLLLGLSSMGYRAISAHGVEEQAYDIAKDLRCLVCQNQTVAESDASIAQDMRQYIALELKKGHTKQNILDTLQEKFGDFIIFTPRKNWQNAFLWGLPTGLLAVLGQRVWQRKH